MAIHVLKREVKNVSRKKHGRDEGNNHFFSSEKTCDRPTQISCIWNKMAHTKPDIISLLSMTMRNHISHRLINGMLSKLAHRRWISIFFYHHESSCSSYPYSLHRNETVKNTCTTIVPLLPQIHTDKNPSSWTKRGKWCNYVISVCLWATSYCECSVSVELCDESMTGMLKKEWQLSIYIPLLDDWTMIVKWKHSQDTTDGARVLPNRVPGATHRYSISERPKKILVVDSVWQYRC